MNEKIKNITALMVEYGFENYKFEVIYKIIHTNRVLHNGGISYKGCEDKYQIIGFKFFVRIGTFEINTELLERFKAAAEKENLFFKFSFKGKDYSFNDDDELKTQIEPCLIFRFSEVDTDEQQVENLYTGYLKHLGMPMRHGKERDEWERQNKINNKN